ncbi:ubiquinone biosynthesis protein [Tieghemostelium lacteum]|uniref:Ubiquinone biosynthesis protein n=1 Tax=Tieghemostelium lacteum TaxID=361077 RepID=A0A151ZH16_TIELA|nr:ubiquinone biosynthesis protein [Tieghemostelium lacteum]|eukprot:KYQ93207.1 ubiquinone biosynthesis protein [Tieghemostelium lacteum]
MINRVLNNRLINNFKLLKSTNLNGSVRLSVNLSNTFKQNNNIYRSVYPTLSCLHYNINKRYYSTININIEDGNNSHKETTDNSSNKTINKDDILENALKYVGLYGWTSEAVSMSCTELGFTPITQGIFGDNSAYSLAQYFVVKCNTEMMDKLKPELLADLSQRERVKLALKIRLSMIKPHIHRWSEAMQILAHPTNITSSLPSMQTLVDNIWYIVGDKSSDFDWYTKRGLLAGLYTSCELFMITDTSADYANTWRFVDDRVDDLINVLKFKNDCEQTVSIAANTLLNYLHKK